MLQRYFDALQKAKPTKEEVQGNEKKTTIVVNSAPTSIVSTETLREYIHIIGPFESMKMANDNRKNGFGQAIARLLRLEQVWQRWYENDFEEFHKLDIFPTYKHAYLWMYNAIRDLLKNVLRIEQLDKKGRRNFAVPIEITANIIGLHKCELTYHNFIFDVNMMTKQIDNKTLFKYQTFLQFIRSNLEIIAYENLSRQEYQYLLLKIIGPNDNLLQDYIIFYQEIARALRQDDGETFELLTGKNLENTRSYLELNAYDAYNFEEAYPSDSDEHDDWHDRKQDEFDDHFNIVSEYEDWEECDERFKIGQALHEMLHDEFDTTIFSDYPRGRSYTAIVVESQVK